MDSIVFLYHQWLWTYGEILDKIVRQGGVTGFGDVYLILERVWRNLNEFGWVLQVCELYKRLQQLEAVNSIGSLKVTIKSWKRVPIFR